jgi:hypothetical protein
MDPRALFGLSIVGSFVSCIVISALYVWPWLGAMERDRAMTVMIAPHMFRFIGLSFLVTGVVSPSLPSQFAVPAAYGDSVAGVLAIIATAALARRVPWATAAVWAFNVWGAADLLFAYLRRCTRSNSTGRAGCCVLHRHGNRASPAYQPFPHLPASCSVTSLKLDPRPSGGLLAVYKKGITPLLRQG